MHGKSMDYGQAEVLASRLTRARPRGKVGPRVELNQFGRLTNKSVVSVKGE